MGTPDSSGLVAVGTLTSLGRGFDRRLVILLNRCAILLEYQLCNESQNQM